MKKLSISILLLAIGMLIQGVADHKAFHKRSVQVAKYSYETGCILEGKKDCLDFIPDNDDESIVARGQCYEFVILDCDKMSVNFETAFDKGPK